MKIGLCGMGHMGAHHAFILKNHKDVEFIAVADAVPENRKLAVERYGVRTYADGEELIRKEKLDAVLVCAPTYLHKKLTVQALEAGCHVFCEKPMARNLEECKAMTDAAQKAGKILMIGQVLRFWPEYVFLKNAVESGKYGKLKNLTMSRVGKISTGWENWFLDEKRGGMQIFDRHIHDSDAVTWLIGMPKQVFAIGTEESAADGGITHNYTHYDFGKEGPMVCVEGSADLPENFPFTAFYRANFEKAAVEFRSAPKPALTVYDGTNVIKPELPKRLETPDTTLNLTDAGPYLMEQYTFFDCIRRGVMPQTITPETAAETIRLALAEIESVRTGKPVLL